MIRQGGEECILRGEEAKRNGEVGRGKNRRDGEKIGEGGEEGIL